MGTPSVRILLLKWLLRLKMDSKWVQVVVNVAYDELMSELGAT
jgi:hypothetical protein